MRLPRGAIGCLVDASAHVGERLCRIGRWVLHDATSFEAEYLRYACADEIGDDDEACVVQAAHKEIHSRQARYGGRAPRPLLSLRRREDEAGQGRADALVYCVLTELPRRGVPESGVRQIAQRDYVVGRAAKKADSSAHKWNGNVIGRTGKQSSPLTPASC